MSSFVLSAEAAQAFSWKFFPFELVTKGVDGKPANGASVYPQISADGSCVVFTSVASNLVKDDKNGLSDVFVYYTKNRQLKRVSDEIYYRPGRNFDIKNSKKADKLLYSNAQQPSVSNDCRFVAFQAFSVIRDNKGNLSNSYDSAILVKDLKADTVEPIALKGAYAPSISGDGSKVSFNTTTSYDKRDKNADYDVYVAQRYKGRFNGNIFQLVSVANSGTVSANGQSLDSVISPDGRYVAFRSLATDLVKTEEPKSRPESYYIRDLTTDTTQWVSAEVDSGHTFAVPPPEPYLYDLENDSSRIYISQDSRLLCITATSRQQLKAFNTTNAEQSQTTDGCNRSVRGDSNSGVFTAMSPRKPFQQNYMDDIVTSR